MCVADTNLALVYSCKDPSASALAHLGKRGNSDGWSGAMDTKRAAPHAYSAKRARQLDLDAPCNSKAMLPVALRRAASAPPETTHRVPEELEDLKHWRGREAALLEDQTLLQKQQPEVTPAMRWMLMDWLAEVRDEFHLTNETFFLSVSYVDRFLCSKPVSRGCFQLLGLAALWVAAKYEEVRAPAARDMLAMAENMYTSDHLKLMEKEILFTLGFELAGPTPLRFLHYFLLLAPLPEGSEQAAGMRQLSEALLELTVLDTAYLRAPPSAVAAAALYLAMGLTGHHAGLSAVLSVSGADPQLLGSLVQDIANTLHAVAQPGQQPCAVLGRYTAWQRWCDERKAEAEVALQAQAMCLSPRAPCAAHPEPPFAVQAHCIEVAGARPLQRGRAPPERCPSTLSAARLHHGFTGGCMQTAACC